MFIVWGSRLMGKCDVVPGLFYVETKFSHIYYLPLIPTASYAVLSKSGKQFSGVPISLSMKSVLYAWLRMILFVAGLIAALAALVEGTDTRHHGNWIPGAIVAGVLWTGCILISYVKFFTHASFARACQLAQELKLTEAGYDMIAKIYGQAVPRGFAVQPRAVNQTATNARNAVEDGPIPLEP